MSENSHYECYKQGEKVVISNAEWRSCVLSNVKLVFFKKEV